MQQQEQLWTEIKFDEADIDAFRSGFLTNEQSEKILLRKEQIRRVETGFQLPLFLLMTAPFALIFGAILLCTVLSSGSRGFSLIIILAAFFIVGALLVLFQLNRARRTIKGLDADLRNKRVMSATGRPKLIYEKGSVQVLYLLIDNLTLLAGWFGNFKTDESRVYRAYFLPESKILLAVEKA
ncbi:MAG: hypothetical protein M3033_00400 [Acidobacteriota bacterium]|nr:hypothetical protein [Acidobacteriota bacterium]